MHGFTSKFLLRPVAKERPQLCPKVTIYSPHLPIDEQSGDGTLRSAPAGDIVGIQNSPNRLDEQAVLTPNRWKRGTVGF